MGTRADFYIGRGKDAEWLGSIAFDGYWDGIPSQILQCTSEQAFKHAVTEFVASRDDGTKPEHGWPWPWDDSNTTDCAYAFDNGRSWQTCFGYGWFPGDAALPEELPEAKTCVFPDMSARKNIAWGNRSGMIVIVSGP